MTSPLKFRIHYTLPDGTEDHIIVTGDTCDEIRDQADKAIAARKAHDPWSDEIKP